MNLLYDDPGLYDIIVPPGPCEVFYNRAAEQAAGPVLELACGTGRLTIPMAATGATVVGLDRSKPMLEQARRKASAAGLAIEFALDDLRTFQLGRKYGLIVLSCNSLAHLESADEVIAFFRRVGRHLAAGGHFAFDILNPDALTGDGRRRTWTRLANGPIEVLEDEQYDLETGVRRLCWAVSDGRVRWTAGLKLRQIAPTALPILLDRAGLKLEDRFGDFDGAPFAADSLNQICVARAA